MSLLSVPIVKSRDKRKLQNGHVDGHQYHGSKAQAYLSATFVNSPVEEVKKYSQKIKVIKYKEEGKEIEFVKSEPKCSGSKKPKKIATEELLDQPSTSVVQEDVRTYVSRKTKEREGWETVQPSMLRARIEEMCPSTWECCFCGKETMHIIYCPDCGPTAYYCETCCTKLHSVVLFHKPCVWKVNNNQLVIFKKNCLFALFRPTD
ncbi:uncharacterized protein LOC133176244 [Saccostrea echinata]|uniref:uncharacterized protein LOC133176244 n=1 Tax=Saccostrea echinata TaxID=191078 RepID=UPI002A82EB5E|nr:uncharacterized protein LOC133176244 [Saccostrea echinata]